MAIKRKYKISTEFSLASMSDLVFLLLIFFMLASTLVAPNALKLLLPQSNNQTAAKPVTTISITKDLQYYINDEGNLRQVAFQEIEPYLKKKFGGKQETYISLYTDRSVPVEQVVKIMNIARKNEFKLILATAPER
jgi:biopolymer transport protein ExbD